MTDSHLNANPDLADELRVLFGLEAPLSDAVREAELRALDFAAGYIEGMSPDLVSHLLADDDALAAARLLFEGVPTDVAPPDVAAFMATVEVAKARGALVAAMGGAGDRRAENPLFATILELAVRCGDRELAQAIADLGYMVNQVVLSRRGSHITWLANCVDRHGLDRPTT